MSAWYDMGWREGERKRKGIWYCGGSCVVVWQGREESGREGGEMRWVVAGEGLG